MKYITIALAKQTLALLEQTGITCEEMKDKNTRKLIFINEELKLKFFLSKTSDVPTYVEYGAADLGVVGSDTIMEEGRKVLEVLANAICVLQVLLQQKNCCIIIR